MISTSLRRTGSACKWSLLITVFSCVFCPLQQRCILKLMDILVQMDRDRFCSENPRTVLAAQGPPHRHLRSVYMSGFCDVLGLAELALYILRNATVLQRMVVDPVAGNVIQAWGLVRR